jgi:hypothetical protein
VTANQFQYHAWLAHRLLPRGQRPTELHLDIARLLARWQHPCPSHSKLARAAGCCIRTVQNALNRLRGLGLLDWTHQGAVVASGRRLRLPNRYRFIASFLLLPPPIRRPAKEERVETLNPISLLGKHEKEALLVKWGLAA